jgi:hypothetical protein
MENLSKKGRKNKNRKRGENKIKTKKLNNKRGFQFCKYVKIVDQCKMLASFSLSG